MDDSKKYALGLRLATGYNNKVYFQLLKSFGNAENAWKAEPQTVKKALKPTNDPNIDAFVGARKNLDIDRLSDELEQKGIDILLFGTSEFPELLGSTPNPPPLLFTKGNSLEKVNGVCVALVGARRATGYGRSVAEVMAKELGNQNVTVVSGLARGIDTAAHTGALGTPGGTIGVLGCGLDICYPPENRRLMNQVVDDGLLISEYPLGTAPLAQHFPARNRIISGLCEAVVVVESDIKSGALITADFALEQGREVFAVPGSVRNILSRGPHKLLKEGASLAESAQDILLELGILAVPTPTVEDTEKVLDKDERIILQHIGSEQVHIDEIVNSSELPTAHVAGVLTMLELKGYLKQDGGKFFTRM